jgi:hypothetical protein
LVCAWAVLRPRLVTATNILAYYLNCARNKTHDEFNPVKIAAHLLMEGTEANTNEIISRTLPALARQAAFDYAKKLGAAFAQVKAEQNVRSQAKDS